jgi:hypothetical protein
MTTVEIPAKVTIEEFFAAVQKLPPQELTELTRRIIALQAQSGLPLLAKDEEQALLETIRGQSLSPERQQRLNALREKSRTEALTPQEHSELLSFVQQVEQQDLTRVEALIKLAQQRGVTLSELLQDLGLEPTYA